jgi:iron complex outermembrane receptor protein
MSRIRPLLSSAALMAGLLPLAHAEDLGIIEVQSSTITDRFEDKRREPSNIAIISGEEIDAAHAENIQQTLQSVPGITTEVQNGDSLKIHIRGVENQRFMGEKPGVAVVIDGVPVFERTGRVNIDLDNIESVRVIKGGASYLFGEDALSGAVIITTKHGAKYAGYKLDAEAGSFGYRKGLARAGFAGDKLNGHVQVSRRRSDGYYFQSDYSADYVDGKLQYYLDEASDLTFGFETADRTKDSHGTVTGVTQARLDPRSVDGRDYARKYDVNLGKYFLTYARDVGAADNLMLNVYRFGDDTQFVSAPQSYDAAGNAVTDVDAYTTGNDYQQVQRGLKGEWRSRGQRAWMAGVDLRNNRYDNQTHYLVDFKRSPRSPTVYAAGTPTGDDTTAERVTAAYGEVKLPLSRQLVLTTNGRYDRIALDYTDRLNDLNLDKTFRVGSWRLGANYAASAVLDVYANASTGFRAPTIAQLFAGTISPYGDTASNPDLRPERAVNLELGLRGKLGGLDFDLAVFQIDRKDYIMSAAGQYSIPDNGVQDQYQNIGGMRNRGLELSLRSDARRAVSYDLAYTYLNAKFTRYDNFNLVLGNRYANPTIVAYDNTGNTVPRVPHHHLNLALHLRPQKALTVTTEMDAVSAYYADELNQNQIGGHTVYNLLLNYDLTIAQHTTWSFFARVDNVFDRSYYTTARGFYDSNGDQVYNAEDLSIVVNPGRVWTVGASAHF